MRRMMSVVERQTQTLIELSERRQPPESSDADDSKVTMVASHGDEGSPDVRREPRLDKQVARLQKCTLHNSGVQQCCLEGVHNLQLSETMQEANRTTKTTPDWVSEEQKKSASNQKKKTVTIEWK